MKNNFSSLFIFTSFILADAGCRQIYQPPTITGNTNYLVVEGFLNAGTDSTIITLTRTLNLSGKPLPAMETGAQVMVEGTGGFTRQLTDIGNGRYAINNLGLDNARQYRVNIITANSSKYLSDYEPVKLSPAIDSISWKRSDTAGVSVYANTHDASGNTKFYRWEYAETWEYLSTYITYLTYNPADGSVTSSGTSSDSVHTCWIYNNSTSILTASSAKLSADLIYLAPLTVIPLHTQRISVVYSILVRQYALTTEAFNFWETLKKSTEQGGNIFDVEPTQITGNMHCITNPAEPVIGFVGAGTVTEKRIFINNSQVAPWVYDPGCATKNVPEDSLGYYYEHTLSIPITESTAAGAQHPRYDIAYTHCVNCTTGGHTNKKPVFWP